MVAMSKRRKRTTQPASKDQRIAELEEQLSQALATIEKLQKLEKEVERLQARVEELERAGKRQATPFARRHWVERPRRAGRNGFVFSKNAAIKRKPNPPKAMVRPTITARRINGSGRRFNDSVSNDV